MSAHHCNHCGNEIQHVTPGRRVLCPVCNKIVEVPGANPGATPPAFPPPLPRVQLAAALPPLPHQPASSMGKRVLVACVVAVAIVAGVGLLGWFGWQVQEKRMESRAADKQAVAGMKEDVDKLMTEFSDEDGVPKKVDLRFDTDGKTPKTDAEKMRHMIRTFFNDMIQFQNSYIAELEAAGLDTLLDPTRFAKDKTGEESRKTIKKLTDLVTEYEKKHVALIHELPKRVDGAGFGVIAKAGMSSQIQKSTADSLSVSKQMWALEKSIMEDYATLIEFLIANRQYWTVEDSQFIFERDSDINRFNEIIDKVTKTGEKQAQIRQASQKKASNAFEGM